MTKGTVIRRNIVEDTGRGRRRTGIPIGSKTDDVTLEGSLLVKDRRFLARWSFGHAQPR